jgi:hypothetical protein
MFIGFAVIIFSIGYFRHTEQNYYEFIQIGEKIDAEIVKIEEIDNKPISFYLSIPFAFVEYGSIDLVYGKPVLRYEKLNGSTTAMVNDYAITVSRSQKESEVLYNPNNDRAIANDTFYLRGLLWISSIVSGFLLVLGLYSLRM